MSEEPVLPAGPPVRRRSRRGPLMLVAALLLGGVIGAGAVAVADRVGGGIGRFDDDRGTHDLRGPDRDGDHGRPGEPGQPAPTPSA